MYTKQATVKEIAQKVLSKARRGASAVGGAAKDIGPIPLAVAGGAGVGAGAGIAAHRALSKKKQTKEKTAETACATPGKKIRSKGKGRGLAAGEGKGPLGRMVATEEAKKTASEIADAVLTKVGFSVTQ